MKSPSSVLGLPREGQGRHIRRARFAAFLVAALGATLVFWGAASCTIDVPLEQEGFACEPDGSCAHGLTCIDGICVSVTDLCLDVDCDPGTVCIDGECLEACLIGGELFELGDLNAGNDCLSCDPSISTSDWSPLAAGTDCGHGQVCDGAGLCLDEDCEEDCSALNGWYDLTDELYPCCDEGLACECIDQEYREYACIDAACEYGITDERLLAEACVSCEDGNPCTERLCEEGACETHLLPAGTPCGTTGECDGEGLCSQGCDIGGETFSGGLVNPGNTCEICDPAISETSWSPRDDVPCVTDNECASGICAGGVCVDVPLCRGDADHCGCDVCVDCTLLDGWVNVGAQYACCDGGETLCNSCQDQEYREYVCADMLCDYTDTDSRTVMSGCTSCTDENDCTINSCDAGACRSEPALTGTHCGTAGECDGAGNCSEGCEIDGVLYADGELNPVNACQVCRTGTSQSSWTDRSSGASCGDGRVCDGAGTCTPRCELPWGGSIGHGESVTAYLVAEVGCEETCPSETLNCSLGVLEGSYTEESCNAPCAACPSETRSWGGGNGCSASVTGIAHGGNRNVSNTIDGRTGSATFQCNDGVWVLQPDSTCTANGCTAPWGEPVAHGNSVTAYLVSEVGCEETCPSETRTCSFGVLSGSYAEESCSAPCASCPTENRTWGGVDGCGASVTGIAHAGTRSVSNTVDGRTGSASFHCNDGTWVLQSGSTCTANGCTAPWGEPVAHDNSVTAYLVSEVGCEETCPSETRTCSFGVLSGSYAEESCSAPCASCPTENRTWGGVDGCGASVTGIAHAGTRSVSNTVDGRTGSASFHCNDGTWVLQTGSTCTANGCTAPWGEPVAHDNSVTAYQSSTVTCGSSCVSQTRICSYGVLSGSYLEPGCAELCDSCPTTSESWGTTHGCRADVSSRPHGSSRTVTNERDGRTGSATFMCHDGTWQLEPGSTCTADSCEAPWEGRMAHGDSVTAYASETVPCNTSCASETRTCDYGTLTGSYQYQFCLVSVCRDCSADNVVWSTHDCRGSTSSASHGDGLSVLNTRSGRSGSATYFCNDGTWELVSGTCTPNNCTAPWGDTVNHGESVTAYLHDAPCDGPCGSQSRTCSYGDLSGTYQHRLCHAMICAGCHTCVLNTCVYGCASGESCCRDDFGDDYCTSNPPGHHICMIQPH